MTTPYNFTIDYSMHVIGKGTLPSGFIWAKDIQANEEAQLIQAIWPNYLIEESDLPAPQPPETTLTKEELDRRFIAWGIREQPNNRLIAFASAILIPVESNATSYSQDGWNYACQLYFDPKKTNCLCLLSANIDPNARGHRFSLTLLEEAKIIATYNNLDCVLAPVRPTKKIDFPEIGIDEYLKMKNESGEIFDPWLRTHSKLGCEILNICERSVIIRASYERWEKWLKQPMTSKRIIPQGGLVPLEVDNATKVATYIEPNVWVRYKIGQLKTLDLNLGNGQRILPTKNGQSVKHIERTQLQSQPVICC